MTTALLIDFGSTFTKLRAVDLEKGEIIGADDAGHQGDVAPFWVFVRIHGCDLFLSPSPT